MRVTCLSLASALLLLPACEGEEKGEGFYVGAKTEECELSFDDLEGTQWAMLEAMPDQTERVNPKARMKFITEDGSLKVMYTVASLGNVYTYLCRTKGEGEDAELQCYEEARVRDWCQALEVWEEGSCTPEKLAEYGHFELTDEEVDELIADAKKWVDQYRGKDEWAQVVLNNNNLGNKLQGQLFIKIDKRKCRLRVSDMYMTIYNGKEIIDSNPVGTNPFVRLEGDYIWDHCADGFYLVDFDEAEPEALEKPETIKPPHLRFHPCNGEKNAMGVCKHPNTTVHYHYLGEEAVKAEEGCSYSYDSYAQWTPEKQNVAVSVGDRDKIKWYGSHYWEDLGTDVVGVYHMVRYKTCDGEKEQIDVVCNAAKFK